MPKHIEFILNKTTDNNKQYIELNKLLKLLRLVDSGAMASHVITDKLVYVNGKIECRKRAKIIAGSIIKFDNYIIEVL